MPVTATTPPSGSQRDPDVRTTAGMVRGLHEAGLAVFRGIPYAEPPAGALRFAAPRPARSWSGIRTALTFGRPPPQPGLFGGAEPARENAGDDWLTLNVWTPDPANGVGLPVMVWIPGGGYVIGASNRPEFDGGRLAAGASWS